MIHKYELIMRDYLQMIDNSTCAQYLLDQKYIILTKITYLKGVTG